jgi:hypothetical protein
MTTCATKPSSTNALPVISDDIVERQGPMPLAKFYNDP